MGGVGLSDLDGAAVDGRDCPLPPRQGLFEVQVNRVDDVVAVADEERMRFLFWSFVSLLVWGVKTVRGER